MDVRHVKSVDCTLELSQSVESVDGLEDKLNMQIRKERKLRKLLIDMLQWKHELKVPEVSQFQGK